MAAEQRPHSRMARKRGRHWRAGIRPMVSSALMLMSIGGCHYKSEVNFSDSWNNYRAVATEIEYPDVHIDPDELVRVSEQPHTVRNPEEKPLWNLTLDEAIQHALHTSEVMRDIGGRIVTAPLTMSTPLD